MSLRDSTIIASLQQRKELPSVNEIISRYKCGYVQATRCRDAVREAEDLKRLPLQQQGLPLK